MRWGSHYDHDDHHDTTKGEESDVVFRVMREHRFFSELAFLIVSLFSLLFLAVHIRRDGARYDASCAIFDSGFSARESFPTVATPIRFRPSCFFCPTFRCNVRVHTRIHTHVRKRVDAFVCFEGIRECVSAYSKGWFGFKNRTICWETRASLLYGFYTALSAPLSLSSSFRPSCALVSRWTLEF